MNTDKTPLNVVIALSHAETPYVTIENELNAAGISPDTYRLIRSEGKKHLEGSLIGEADILVAWNFPEELFPLAERLKWVHFAAAGVDGILYPRLLKSNIKITSSSGAHEQPVAEHTMALILTFARGLHISIRNQRERRWDRRFVVEATQELSELTLGIIGLGRIGRAIARLGRAFGMRVIGVDPHGKDLDELDRVYPSKEIGAVLEQADYLVLAVPYTPENHHLIGLDEIRLMKEKAVLVNIGRGKLVNEPILIDALSRGWIGGAALDVFEEEPLSPDSRLYNLGNVIITPHVAGVTPIYWNRMAKVFATNFDRFISDEPMLTEVNRDKGY